MQTYLGLGSNLGNRRQNLSSAIGYLKELFTGDVRISPVYETPALLAPGAPAEWNKPYLNLVFGGETRFSPRELLAKTSAVESSMGRVRNARWAPRSIDIDILWYNDEKINLSDLKIPHPEIGHRTFVLDPLKDLAPYLKVPASDGSPTTVLQAVRRLPGRVPKLMAVINLTPDSFSDGGRWTLSDELNRFLDEVEDHVHYLDLGAESTRPGAGLLTWSEEWERLKPILELLRMRYANRQLAPLLSVDTRHAEIAERAVDYGARLINDVSGLSQERMVSVIKTNHLKCVLMHNLGIPPSAEKTLSEDSSPVLQVKSWFEETLNKLQQNGVGPESILLDPGIGFGKTAAQSLEIIKNINQFLDFPHQLMVGHSRKSFLSLMTEAPAKDRDIESVAASLYLSSQGVDILRVHNPLAHARALKTWAGLQAAHLPQIGKAQPCD